MKGATEWTSSHPNCKLAWINAKTLVAGQSEAGTSLSSLISPPVSSEQQVWNYHMQTPCLAPEMDVYFLAARISGRKPVYVHLQGTKGKPTIALWHSALNLTF